MVRVGEGGRGVEGEGCKLETGSVEIVELNAGVEEVPRGARGSVARGKHAESGG